MASMSISISTLQLQVLFFGVAIFVTVFIVYQSEFTLGGQSSTSIPTAELTVKSIIKATNTSMRLRKFNKVQPKSIDVVRESVMSECKSNPDQYSKSDIDQLSLSDWMILRFLEPVQGDEKKATSNLINTLKWRKSKDFPAFGEKVNMPDIFFKIGLAFIYEPDKWGHRSLYVRVKYLRKISEIRPLIKMAYEYMVWKIDEDSRELGWIMIFDFKDAGLVNADLETLHDLINTLKTHFPCGLDYLLVVDIPWILKGFWALVSGWASTADSLVKFVSRKDIYDYYQSSNLPDFMGGTCKKPYCGDAFIQSLGLKCINGSDLFTYCHEYLKLSKEKSSEIESIYRPMIESTCSSTQV